MNVETKLEEEPSLFDTLIHSFLPQTVLRAYHVPHIGDPSSQGVYSS